MSIPTNALVQVRRRSSSTTDSYGNPTGPLTTVLTTKAWIERTSYNEPRMDGDTDAQDWLLLFPGTVTVLDGDTIVWDGESYEVANYPAPQQPPGGSTHHTETRMRPGLTTLRSWFLRTLIDECTIERKGTETFDPGTGDITPGARTTIYEGPCLLRSRDAYNRETRVVDNTTTLQSYNAFIPHDVVNVEDDDILTVTTSDDARLVGRELRITAVRLSTDLTGRVLALEDDLG